MKKFFMIMGILFVSMIVIVLIGDVILAIGNTKYDEERREANEGIIFVPIKFANEETITEHIITYDDAQSWD